MFACTNACIGYNFYMAIMTNKLWSKVRGNGCGQMTEFETEITSRDIIILCTQMVFQEAIRCCTSILVMTL